MKVTVNDTTVEVPDGSNVSVIGGQIVINGKLAGSSTTDLKIEVFGGLINLRSDRSVEVAGSVTGDVDAGGSVKVMGDVGGNVDAGGSVNCGDVKGKIDAGGSVNCKRN